MTRRTKAFPAWPESVPVARRFVSETLDRIPRELCQTAALLVSELATNVVRHSGAGEFVVEVDDRPDQGRLWVGVTDSGTGLPILRAPSLTAEHGRGMQLVATLADRWGAGRRRGATEKTVWFELRYA
jgi:anti-sigma regulatory factor (Ser/Thr protein kinase)